MEIVEKDAAHAWTAALRALLEHGKSLKDDRGKDFIEVLNLSITISIPDDISFPALRLKDNGWVYPSLEELESVILKKEPSGSYYYTYGARIFKYSGVLDQVNGYILPLLKKKPTSRRAVIGLYNPLVDSREQGLEAPAITTMFFRVVGTELELTVILRSCDLLLGWPANIYQSSIIQDLVASGLGLTKGPITTICHSSHAYADHLEKINSLLANTARV